MASLVLGAVGSIFLGPIGGLVGGIVGGIIDQSIVMMLQDPIEGPRLDELRVPSFDEGSPCPWVQGSATRVPGQLLWVSKMREDKVTEGGKGGGGGTKTVAYEYYIDVAVAI